MSKFRKKTVIVEAVQWFTGTIIDGVEEFPPNLDHQQGHAHIKTLEGTMEANPGDWIITGVKGEKYPCKPDIFDATYEAVEENK